MRQWVPGAAKILIGERIGSIQRRQPLDVDVDHVKTPLARGIGNGAARSRHFGEGATAIIIDVGFQGA